MSSNINSTQTLTDAKNSADLYLEEAELCANHTPKVLGFAAMSLTLACVVSVGEALTGQVCPSDESCIRTFCAKMVSFDWLLSPSERTTNPDPASALYGVRNALAHALSLPNDICLVPRPEIYYATYSTRYSTGIVPSLFVDAVRRTLDDIVQQYPQTTFDRLSSKRSRSPVKVDQPPSGGSIPGR